jgi:hypothetical protein
MTRRPRRSRLALEGHLLRQRHVVAEQEDVQPERQRLQGLGGGIGAGYRDLRQAGAAGRARRRAGRLPQRPRRRSGVAGGAACA